MGWLVQIKLTAKTADSRREQLFVKWQMIEVAALPSSEESFVYAFGIDDESSRKSR
jgi:hypothetical protein